MNRSERRANMARNIKALCNASGVSGKQLKLETKNMSLNERAKAIVEYKDRTRQLRHGF